MKKNNYRSKKKKSLMDKLAIFSPSYHILKTGSKLHIHDCLINRNWKKSGIATIVLARKKKHSDKLIIAAYFVDMKCLGIKDSLLLIDKSEAFYKDWLRNKTIKANMDLIPIEPKVAFNIIYGAVDYAATLGFFPAKKYKTTKYLLDGEETVEHVDIHFGGEDGKPLFIANPYDNTAKILQILVKNVGKGNFNYISLSLNQRQ